MVQHLYARSFMLMILGSLLSFGWVMAQEEPPDEPDEAVVPIFDLTGSDASEPAEPQETVPVVPIVPVQVLPTPPPGAMQPFSLADSLLQATTCPDRLANSPVVVSTFTQLDQAVACANASTTPYIIYLADQTSTFQFTHTLSVTGHVEIYGRGATLSVLDGMGANRLFSVAGQLLLSHVTLRNAKPPINYGGAMRNSGHLTLQDSVMTGNHVRHGGGAILSTGTLTIERTHFVNNRAGGGAGIQMSGTATLSCVLFQGNTHHATQVRDYASALLVHNDGTATIRHSTFANPTTDEISTQDAAQVDARENYWSGRTVPADVNQYGSQVTFGSELSQNPITTNPDCAFKAPIAIPGSDPKQNIINELAAYGVVIDRAEDWSETELQEALHGVQAIGNALVTLRTGAPNVALFRGVMGVDTRGNVAGRGTIVLRRNTTTPYCESNLNQLPRAITCGHLVDANGQPRALSRYVIVHELGHIFDNQSAQNGQKRLSTRVADTPLADGRGWVMGRTTFTECFPGDDVFSDPTVADNRVWRRGERGWGSGPGSLYRPATGQSDKCARRDQQNFTNFQQNPPPHAVVGSLTPLDLRTQETAADLFLNWVFRSQNLGGFANASWKPNMRSASGQYCNQIATGCPDSHNPGDARFNWTQQQITDIFTQQGW